MSKNNNPEKNRYYIAYGSNLNREQMTRRCPTAETVQATCLKNFRLIVDDAGTVFVDWDCGSGLGIVYGADRVRKL